MQSSLVVAERSGDLILREGNLFCLVVAALRRHNTEGVRRLAPRCEKAGTSAGFPEVVGTAKGCLAWLAWEDGDPGSVLSFAREAEHLLRTRGHLAMLRWTYLCRSWLYTCATDGARRP